MQGHRVVYWDTYTLFISMAGSGTRGYRDGISNTAMFDTVKGVAATPGDSPIMFICDHNNHVIRMHSSVTVSTIAGVGRQSGYAGDGGAPLSARLSYPDEIVVHPTTGLVCFHDSGNAVIRCIDRSKNTIKTLVGTAGATGCDDGAAGRSRLGGIRKAMGLAITGPDQLLIADSACRSLRSVQLSTGIVTTVYPSATSRITLAANATQFDNPAALTYDAFTNVTYISDMAGSIYMLNSQGVISLLAGSTSTGFADGPAALARFKGVSGMAVQKGSRTLFAAGELTVLNGRMT